MEAVTWSGTESWRWRTGGGGQDGAGEWEGEQCPSAAGESWNDLRRAPNGSGLLVRHLSHACVTLLTKVEAADGETGGTGDGVLCLRCEAGSLPSSSTHHSLSTG